MKVAFVIPFAFERFFHDVKDLHNCPDKFEDKIISKRNTWHFNWCRAMQLAGMEVTFYHLSLYAKKVRTYTHDTGVKIIRVPVNFKGFLSGEEYSFSLLKELSKNKPEVVFSVTHMLEGIPDMYDILAFYCHFRHINIVARNPGADSYNFIFRGLNRKKDQFKEYNKERDKRIVNTATFKLKILRKTIQAKCKFLVKQYALERTSLIIPQTRIDYENLKHKFGISEKNLALLPKPVDLEHFNEIPKEIAARNLKMDPSVKYILHVSNLFNTKGCEHIINLLPELIKLYPGVKLLVSGGGPKRIELERQSERMKVKENVVFLGQMDRSKLVNYYNVADVFVLPTEIENEGQANAIMEAIACNTSVISTKLPGPTAVISPGLGLLIPKGNEDELLIAIRKVLDGDFIINPKERNRFLKDYSFEAVGKNLMEHFIKL